MSFEGKPISAVIDYIVWRNHRLWQEWNHIWGWGPAEAAQLIEDARLDWIASLSHTLRLWVEEDIPDDERDGRLILGWANLGSLVEGSMKFLLSIYAVTYQQTVSDKRGESIYKRLWDEKANTAKGPDTLMFDMLREFFRANVWTPDQVEKWDKWLIYIRDCRNAIHAYRSRPLGTVADLEDAIRAYEDFLDDIAGRLPDRPQYEG